jgi:hypothetical protein
MQAWRRMIPLRAWLVAGAAALAFSIAWKVQAWRYEAEISGLLVAAAQLEAERAASVVAAVGRVRVVEQRMFEQQQEAERNAKQREQAAAVVVAAARAESLGLRDQLGAIRADFTHYTEAAYRERTNTLVDVFGECVAEYQALAERADGHARDVVLFMESWPKPL